MQSMCRYREVKTLNADGTFTYTGRIIRANPRKLMGNPFCPGTMTTLIPFGHASYVHVILDPKPIC
jgi:hypothetical protein